MDEWIAVGDAEFRQRAHERLTSLLEQAHILVFASHDASLIRSLCNKVIRLDHGVASEVVSIDRFDELMAVPSVSGTF